jgi:hypothetical protein
MEKNPKKRREDAYRATTSAVIVESPIGKEFYDTAYGPYSGVPST